MFRQKKLSEIIIDTDYGIKVIVGASGFSKVANMEDAERTDFIEQMTELASEFDVIVIDTSAGISHNVLSFVAAADDVVVVTTTEPTAITDAYGIIKVITTEIDNTELHLKMIVNRVSSAIEGKKIADKIIRIAAQFLHFKIEYLGFIYNDSGVSRAVVSQKPFVICEPNGKAAICLKHIVARLEKTEIPESGGFKGFIRKWLRQ